MIPLRDVIPSRTVPGVVIALVAAHAAAFAAGHTLPERDVFAARIGLAPADAPPVRILASMFVHASTAHLGVNALFLVIFGRAIEDRLGHVRFAAFYLLCGAGAAIADGILRPGAGTTLPGASGAIGGIVGAYFALFPRSKIVAIVPLMAVPFIEIPAVAFLGLWLLVPLALGLGPLERTGPGTHAFWVYLTSVGMGAAAVLVFKRPERLRVEWWDRYS